MRLHVGTSGFSYTAWRGRFYPPRLPPAEMLRYYAERFDTVEINSTFYRPPEPERLASWYQEVPAEFRFALKAPRRITHERRLVDVGRPVAAFLQASAELGRRLGPILFQLPPNLPLDLARFDAFLAMLPQNLEAAFEFRHASWLTEAVFDRLRQHRKALCFAETDEARTPFEVTAPFGYVRLRKTEYARDELAAWVEHIRAAGWDEAFVFFMHEIEARGPLYAAQLRALAGEGAEAGAAAPGPPA